MEQKSLNDVMEKMNPAQQEATKTITGPLLIVAGAGSGKTTVLTARIANLIELGIIPERILALTFTKKAAKEMQNRIEAIVGPDARRLVMGTFHSVFISMIRPYAHLVGYKANFTIMDEDDSISCIKRCISTILEARRKAPENRTEQDIKLYKKEDEAYKPKKVKNAISWAKNQLVTPEAYALEPEFLNYDRKNGIPLLKEIYKEYRDTSIRSNTMDFDDILLYLNMILYRHEDVRSWTASRFDYILIDEYQDTNFAQYHALRLLTEKNKNVCVVGDDSQSIYAFRGADINNILNFKTDYPGTRTIKLERNYRSSSTIVNAANNLISHNSKQIKKECFSLRGKGEDIVFENLDNEISESTWIASEIRRLMGENPATRWDDFAVLYRTNAQSRALEDGMIKAGIPYVVYGGTSFFERMEVKDHLAYFRLAVNPDDDESVRRVINKPARGIGEAAMKIIEQMATARKCSLWQLICSPDFLLSGIKGKTFNGIEDFKDAVFTAINASNTMNAYDAANCITERIGLLNALKAEALAKDSEARDRAENVIELLDSVKSYQLELKEQNAVLAPNNKRTDCLGDYLQGIALITSSDKENSEGKVILMTVHSAKGLEFDNVFVAGLEDNLFPLRIEKTRSELEEERRLFYVAVTRAKNRLFLTRAKKRMRFGTRKNTEESKFLSELQL